VEAEMKMKEASVGYRRMEVINVVYSNGIAAGDEAHRAWLLNSVARQDR
jgi:hypothetical protein